LPTKKQPQKPVITKETRNELEPGLYVVATPIGNLEDLTPRARRVLEQADAVLCEDTRRTSELLSALGLKNSLERLDAHASEKTIERAVERLQEGQALALVTDAGTPGVSDPAAALVAQARAAGITIVPVVGPSAVTALLSVSGFPETAFEFRGFFPRQKKEQNEEIGLFSALKRSKVGVWFESPHRISFTFECFAELCPEAEGVVAKEMTKIHERFFTGRAKDLLEKVKNEIAREGERGEWCFAFFFNAKEATETDSEKTLSWNRVLELLLESGVSVSESSRAVSQAFGVAKKKVYAEALKKSDPRA